LKRDEEVGNSERIGLGNLIPIDWFAINGWAHAPWDMITGGNGISPGSIYMISGNILGGKNTLGYGSNQVTLGFCGMRTKSDPSDKSFCDVHEHSQEGYDRNSLGHSFDLIRGKKPCGVRFNGAGAFTGTKGSERLSEERSYLTKLMTQGYDVNITVLSGMNLDSDRDSSSLEGLSEGLFPSDSFSPETFYFAADETGARATVSWKEDLGGCFSTVKAIDEGLRSLGFNVTQD
jgi:hypothetical protein